MTETLQISAGTTQQEVADIVANFKQGQSVFGLQFVDAASELDELVEAGAQISKPLLLGDDLLFVQPDGTIIGLLDGAKANVMLTADKYLVPVENLVTVAAQRLDWTTLGDAVQVSLAAVSTTAPAVSGGSGEEVPVEPGDPLIGIGISPLLPPTDYTFPEFLDREVGVDTGIGLPDVQFAGDAVLLTETDGLLALQFASFVQAVAGGAAEGEEITGVTLTVPGLPLGAVSSAGSFVSNGATKTFVFSGSLADYQALTLSFPTDFSTEARTDAASGDLTATISATSSFLGSNSTSFPIRVDVEGDVDFIGPGILEQDETDAAVTFILADALFPQAGDDDGSETLTGVSLQLVGLPAGAEISTDGGNSFTVITGNAYDFSGTAAEYAALRLQLPADFSTTNPQSEIRGTLRATTDENGDDARDFFLVVNDTPDVNVNTPPSVSADEDGDGVGVTVDTDLNIEVTDQDDSEILTQVEMVFTGLPPGAVFSDGTFTAGSATWIGTVDQANDLQITLPQDYSGTFSSVITATSPEGSDTGTQNFEIRPAGDITITNTPIVTAETDAPLVVSPSASWQIAITDTDQSAPFETLETVRLTLNGMPPGVLAQNVPASTVTYDATNGGTFVFDGTGDEYALLNLVLPTDYSSGGALTGTIVATSTESDPSSPARENVSLTITPEGDVALDVVPLTELVETDAAIVVALRDIMTPAAVDLDGSEALSELVLEITGLPGADFTLGNIANLALQPGESAALTTAPDGSQTLSVTLNTGDLAARFATLELTLPADFSTTNRSDLSGGNTARNIDVSLTATTDEDADTTVDGPNDGQITGQATITVAATPDIDLTVPPTTPAFEDNGVENNADGVTVPLGIVLAISDTDGSESAAATGTLATTVTIDFRDLPTGSTFPSGTFDAGLSRWTGSVAEANALSVNLPGNYAGVILANVNVETPEGTASSPTTIVVTPTADINISGDIYAIETDAPVTVLLSDFISLTITDQNETLQSLRFTLPDLPPGTTATNASGQAVGSFTPDGAGRFVFSFDTATAPGVDPAGISLTFPKDFSTVSPDRPLAATLEVVTEQNGTTLPPRTEQIGVVIDPEGDVQINKSGDAVLQETDAPVDFRPIDFLEPEVTDEDGSEAIQSIGLTFDNLPAGTLFSTDGVTFSAALPTLNFTGTLAEYTALTLRLPADFSTTHPATTLQGALVATTNEVGEARETFDVTVNREGDLTIIGTGRATLTENDAPGVIDGDATTQAPLRGRLADVISAQASDADSSETIVQIDVTVSGLPAGTLVSLDNGLTFSAAANAYSFTDIADYENVIVELPADFSTDTSGTPITGTVTFSTDEALANGETTATPNGGVREEAFLIEVTAEADVRITGQDITVIEDLGAPIDLGQAVAITDVDGSETLTSLSVTFDGLSASGNTLLSDGTVLTAANNVWTGTPAALSALQITSFPAHFSGIVALTTTVVTNETGAAGQSAVHRLAVTPVAEPVVSLSVDATQAGVTQISPAQASVKEDTSFTLNIDASTPDQDGSESLREVVIDNMPTGWLRAGDGAIDLSLFTSGAGDVASARVDGTTLTITFNPGVTDFDGALTVTPLADDDRDVSTLTGDDLVARVTADDTAAGLTTSTQIAEAGLDVDVDAVVDPLRVTTQDQTVTEDQNNPFSVSAGITDLALQDTDGSENFQSVTFTLSIESLTSDIDAALANDIDLDFGANNANVSVLKTDTSATDQQVTFTVTKPNGVTNTEFAAAIEGMEVTFPAGFSGRATLDGAVNWAEAADVDAEFDTTDNAASQPFTTVLTIDPLANALMLAEVFVTDANAPNYLADGSPQRVPVRPDAQETDLAFRAQGTLTLLESTDDGSGPGQVEFFFRLSAETADKDGSESLQTLVITDLPSSWIGEDEKTDDVTLTQRSFKNASGTDPIDTAEFDKIDTAFFDASTGTVTITFKPGVTKFDGALPMTPALYEDYDADRANTDPFTADGTFFGRNPTVTLTTQDGNTLSTATRSAAVTFDVDVDPVNNDAIVANIPQGNEAVIDAAGGVMDFSFTPTLPDMDGSETIISAVLRGVPDFLTVYVPDPDNPTGPKIPALLTAINTDAVTGDITLDWSLSEGQWNGAELRGFPPDYADDFPIDLFIITEEANGGTRGTELNDQLISIAPVVDGGNPSATLRPREDEAILVELSDNVFDSTSESVESRQPGYTIFNVGADSAGRAPRFFDGPPNQTGTDANGAPIYDNELFLQPDGTLIVSDALEPNLYVLTGQDSNETVSFQVRATYAEDNDASQTIEVDGTITLDVTGVADAPDVTVQDPNPDNASGGFGTAQIRDVYERDDPANPGTNTLEFAYAYAGFNDQIFSLDQRLSNGALASGNFDRPNPFVAADDLSGSQNEIEVSGGQPDGSETLYYIITDVPADLRLVGGTPIDASGSSYLVTAAEIGNLSVYPTNANPLDDVNYFDLTLNAIVAENDADFSSVPSLGGGASVQQVLDAINALDGGSVTSTDFTIMLLDSGNGGVGTMPCQPGDPEALPMPTLTLVGTGFEDTANAFKLALSPVAGYWDSISDLVTLPNGVVGDFGFGLTLPEGATLSSDVPGAVLFDPLTGQYAIDFAALGTDPANPLQTAGSIIYTPPPHQSTGGGFAASETVGTDDPYDGPQIFETTYVLNNFTCGEFLTDDTQDLAIDILPIADGPEITIGAPVEVLEDGAIATNIVISSADGGERVTGDVVVTLTGDPGAQLEGAGGVLTPDSSAGGVLQYTLSPGDVAGLSVIPAAHFSGEIEIAVTATTQDIDLSTATGTARQTITVEPDADPAEFVYNGDATPTETGLPLVTDPTGSPIVTILEDTGVRFGDIFTTAGSPDQDGSEVGAAVITVPDYVVLSGAAGIVDNGDGSYTVPVANLPDVTLSLADTHARTPDALDPEIASAIPVSLTINTLELANADQAEADTTFRLRIQPDADKPTVSAEITPAAGTEDDATAYTVTLSGETPDPHETLSFEVVVPVGSTVFIDGFPQPEASNGRYTIAGKSDTTYSGTGAGFVADGSVTFTLPEDLSGSLAVEAVAISDDSGVDTERSDDAGLALEVTAQPDLTLTETQPTVTLNETDAAVSFKPIDNLAFSIDDVDGSETLTSLDLTVTNLPAGTTYDLGAGQVATSGTLALALSEAELMALEITLPADFATNTTPIAVAVSATTNEGAAGNAGFEVEVAGEEDIALSVSAPASVESVSGASVDVAVNIAAQITDSQPTPSEIWQRVTLTFNNPLPAATVLSFGVLAADGRTILFEPNGLSTADFEAALSSFTLTLPAGFDRVIEGRVVGETNHGQSPEARFTVDVNAPPEVSGVVDLGPFDATTSFDITFAQLRANASDADDTTVENISTVDPDVQIAVNGEIVTITVPDGYAGTPELIYDVVDLSATPARTEARATLDIDTLQLVTDASGTTTTLPNGATATLVGDVTGDPAFGTVARGTGGNDFVDIDATRDYDGIAAFELGDGDDQVIVSDASIPQGFTLDGGDGMDYLSGNALGPSMMLQGGAGNDVLTAGGGGDQLEGGTGLDTLIGGDGGDRFILTGGSITVGGSVETDRVENYDISDGDEIDLTQEIAGIDDITGIVEYDNSTGLLSVNGQDAFAVFDGAAAAPAQVAVVFEDSAGAAQIAVI